jgi:hypothetical protein
LRGSFSAPSAKPRGRAAARLAGTSRPPGRGSKRDGEGPKERTGTVREKRRAKGGRRQNDIVRLCRRRSSRRRPHAPQTASLFDMTHSYT